mmetsp:Transcript_11568/g.18815  ORF Transcript_11568/g.18815 Transcript_11568/m.18815 type:complete len:134 (-) Transcript_11568:174-575(-)
MLFKVISVFAMRLDKAFLPVESNSGIKPNKRFCHVFESNSVYFEKNSASVQQDSFIQSGTMRIILFWGIALRKPENGVSQLTDICESVALSDFKILRWPQEKPLEGRNQFLSRMFPYPLTGAHFGSSYNITLV